MRWTMIIVTLIAIFMTASAAIDGRWILTAIGAATTVVAGVAAWREVSRTRAGNAAA